MTFLNRQSLLILLIVISSITALVLFRQPLITWYLYPPSSFDVESVQPAPDYGNLRYWSAHPSLESSAKLVPSGASSSTGRINTTRDVDVFFIQPTTYFGPGKWNADMSLQEFAAQGTEHVVATMASVFSACCRVYAPRYRQAHLAAFLEEELQTPSYKALDLAYSDVELAFRHFLSERDPTRPFIIASHSQGSLHAVRLMNRMVIASPLRDQLVAAYLIGYWLPADALTAVLDNTPLCQFDAMTGCVITYDTYDNTGPGRIPGGKLPFWFPHGWQWISRQKTLCVNPLSWQTDDRLIGKNYHLGAIPMRKVNSLSAFLSNRNPGFIYSNLGEPDVNYTSAQCRADGSLLVTSQTGTPYENSGGGSDLSLHPNDWNLFYMNIRENAQTRIDAYYTRTNTAQ